MTVGRINATLAERRYKETFSHKSHQFSKRLPLPRRRSEPDWRFAKADLRAHESDRHFPTACRTRRAPTIFRPTNFRKAKTARLDRPPGREFSRLRGVYVQKQRLTQPPTAEIGEAQLATSLLLSQPSRLQ